MIVERIGGTSFSLSTFREIDFSLSTNRDSAFVYFQGYISMPFRDTMDETSHCGRYPAIVQRRVHSMINL